MNVLLLIMDSVRAKNTSLHGHSRDTTPYLDRFAEECQVYTQARSPSRWSIPSHASIFTGEHVLEHGVTDIGDKLPPGETVFSTLNEAGYDTAVFSRNSFLTLDKTGLNTDFQTVEPLRDPPFPNGVNPAIYSETSTFLRNALNTAPVRSLLNAGIVKLSWDFPHRTPRRIRELCPRLKPDRKYVSAFLDWIDGRNTWAACVNLVGAHGPLRPTRSHWESPDARAAEKDAATPWDFYEGIHPWETLEGFEDLYDESLLDVDTQIERIIERLRETGELEDTLVVITSDHGEGFGAPDPLRDDVRICGHTPGTHEHLFHVPLLVYHPAITPEKIRRPVTLTEFSDVVGEAISGHEPSFGDMDVWAFDVGDIPGRTTPEYVDEDEYTISSEQRRCTMNPQRVRT